MTPAQLLLCPTLPAPAKMARQANDHRKNARPQDPKDLEFILDENHITPGFFRRDIRVGAKRHIMLASDDMLHHLGRTYWWFMDATFRVVRAPFTQLFSIHGFATSGPAIKQIPLVFVIMSGKRTDDYAAVFSAVLELVHGDDLMRLPSHTYDKEDLIRNMSVAEDDPGEVVEAEDYLQPQSRSSFTPGNSPTKSSMTHPLLTPDEPETSTSTTADPKQFSKGKEAGGSGHSHPRREKRYGHLESAAARRRDSPTRGRGDSDNTRYSSDPMKMLMPDMDKSPDDDEKGHGLSNGYPDMPPSPPPPLPVDGPPRRRLPVDEDDYLQPKSTNPAAYMDLVDGKDYYNEINEVSANKPKKLSLGGGNYNPMGKPVCTIDNPEYFDQLDDPFESEPNGIFKPMYIDPHNYYNDCDVKHPSERTPLNHRPTESTV